MTSEQLAALESVAGRTLSEAEITAIESVLDARNDVAIAAILNDNAPDVDVSIAVEDVFDVLFFTGDYLTLKTAQLAGDATAAMAFSVLTDAKTIGPGKVNLSASATVGLFDALEAAGLLSAAGRAALVEKGKQRPAAIPYSAVSDALNVAEGRLTL